MLCGLDDFAFESSGVNLQNIQRQSVYRYANHELIKAHDEWQAVGQYERTITLSGILVRYPNSALDDLHRLAERKKPVTLAFDDGRAATVIIQEINTDQSLFLPDGKFLKQDFDVLLGVVNGSI